MFELPVRYECTDYNVTKTYYKAGREYDLSAEDKEGMRLDLVPNSFIIPMYYVNDNGNFFTRYELRVLDPLSKKCSVDKSSGSLAKIGDQIYMYKFRSNTVKTKAFMWLVSLGLTGYNIVHNIFIKSIKVLFIMLFSAMGVKFEPLVKENAERMWKGGSPWKALLVIIPQIVLGVLSTLTFGLLSTDINRYIGVLESWSLGITKEMIATQSFWKRAKTYDIMAPCQQPICPLKKDTLKYQEVELALHNEDRNVVIIELTTDIPEELVRSELCSFGEGYWERSIPSEFIQFSHSS